MSIIKMKLNYLLGVFCLAASTAFAQSPVTVTVDTHLRGYSIPADFSGVSIFTGTQVKDHRGIKGNLFSGTNTQLITLFKNSGLHHVRLGATGSPTSGTANLPHEDIDALFAFAKAADVKVIYSLHFADGPATAKYIWEHYRPYVDYFAFDNEPDGRLHDDAASVAARQDYFSSWHDFSQSVMKAAPGAKFAGPDAAGRTLVPRFVKAERDYDALALVTQHIYVGGSPIKKHIDQPHAIENMLSPGWDATNYPQLYKMLDKQGFPFRLTESDDHTHGVTNASDAFCAALWALDYSHWWAEHGAAGVNFQNTEWLTTDTFYMDGGNNYQIHPKAYGIRAFDIGSHGKVEPVTLANTDTANLTAYAVGDAQNLFVTVINKEYGPKARNARVTIVPQGLNPASAAAMFLTVPNGDVAATNGMTLGGAAITNDFPWQGKWTDLKLTSKQCVVSVPAASAAVIKISAAQ